MLRTGYSEQAVITEVNRRHIPEKIDATSEEALSTSGVGPRLMTALKDKKNILTENQKDAYDQRAQLTISQNGRTSNSARAELSARASAEEQEHQRLTKLQEQGFRNTERTQAEQVGRDRDQRRADAARSAAIDRQNHSRVLTNRTIRGTYSPRPYRQ